MLECGDALFELHVQRHGSGNGTHSARADAIASSGLDRGFAQLGMRSQAEIVIGGEINYVASVKSGLGRALRFQHTQALVSACTFPGFDLFSEPR